MRFASRVFVAVLLIELLACVRVAAGPLQRVANTTLAMPSAPPSFGYTSTNAFGNLTFTNPVAIVSPPGETNRLFIVGKNGVIFVVTNLAAPSSSVFMDITSKVTSTVSDSGGSGEQGLLGLAFHPGYATNHYFFVYYTGQANNGTSGLHDILSRFQISAVNTNTGDPATEVRLIAQYDRDVNHNAGDLHFGPDGYLYLSLGDEGAEYDGRTNAQRIDLNFFSAIIRIDVDKRPGSLAPNPGTESATSSNYAVPPDNPFVGATSFDGLSVNPSSVRTEFWAVGLRNPFRFSFDPLTGALYCGDVGQDKFEEVNLITRGGNYGWANYEGVTNASVSGHGLPHLPAVNPISPIITYAHGTGTNVGNCVIGGVVYRGQRLPQLSGYYLFADEVRGNMWAIPANQTNGTAGPPAPLFVDSSAISAFGTDPSNGDILYACLNSGANGVIKRIIFNSVTNGAPIPPTLADTGAFTNLNSIAGPLDMLQPAAGIVLYDINVPFWSDNAIKSRWFSVPNVSQTIGFNPNGNWSFPTGTVWIKHFNLQLTNGDPSSQVRLETRLLVRNSGGVYGVTYRWAGSKTNATLVDAGGLDEPFVVNDGGGVLRTQVWHYPSQLECQTCHTPAGGLGLGFRTEQLNKDFAFAGGVTNQLSAYSDAGYFSSPLTNDVHALLALAAATNTSASLEFRARSFLMANCSQCHQPSGTAQQASWDARITTPTALAGLINGGLVNNLGDPNNLIIKPLVPSNSVMLTRISTRDLGSLSSIQMPPLDSNLIDTYDATLLTQWILSLTNTFFVGAAPDPQSVTPGDDALYSVTVSPTPDFSSAVTLSATGLPPGASAVFTPPSVTGSNSCSLDISTTIATPLGSYLVSVIGSGGGVSCTDTVSLVVSANVTPPGVLVWTDGSGSDNNWSTSPNWTNIIAGGGGPPTPVNDTVFTNSATASSPSTVNNIVDTSTTVNSLWYSLPRSSSAVTNHVTLINPGVTLNVNGSTNITGGTGFTTTAAGLLVGWNNSASPAGAVGATITGAGGTLSVNNSAANIAVAEFNTSGKHPASASVSAALDLHGLDTFTANCARLLVGTMNNGSAGALFLARTNAITLTGSAPQLDVGDNNSNQGDTSFLYLGVTNAIFADSVAAGRAKGTNGVILFNPAFIAQSPAAFFRGHDGSSRVSTWVICDLLSAGGTSDVTEPKATNDFTGGTVNILVDGLALGKTTATVPGQAANLINSNRLSIGALTFNAGVINANNVTNGWQVNNLNSGANSTDTGIGVINVNGAAALSVNQNLILGSGTTAFAVHGTNDALTPVTNSYALGALNIAGGSVFANNLLSGGGFSFVTNSGGSLTVTNSLGTTARPVGALALSSAALHLRVNAALAATNVVVTNLVVAGVNSIRIDAVSGVSGTNTVPLISYAALNGSVAGNFALALPSGYAGALVDDSADKLISLRVFRAPPPVITGVTLTAPGLVMSGSNGQSGATYYVLTSTNVSLPLAGWTLSGTGLFDNSGNFIFTNTISTNAPLQFYLLQLP